MACWASAYFAKGVLFKNIIEHISKTNLIGSFIFDKELIRYVRSNKEGTLFNDFELYPTVYKFNVSTDVVTFGFDCEDIKKSIKELKGQKGIYLMIISNDSNIQLRISIISANVGPAAEENITFINNKIVSPEEWGIGSNDFNVKLDNPTTQIAADTFSEMSAAIKNFKSKVIKVFHRDNNIIFQVSMSNKLKEFVYPVLYNSLQIGKYRIVPISPAGGRLLISDGTEPPLPEMPKHVIKLASDIFIKMKLHALCKGHYISLYFDTDPRLPIRLLCSIIKDGEQVGKAAVYLKDATNELQEEGIIE